VGTGVEPVKFCKIAPGGACSAITLPIPGASSLSDSASAAIPVFGPGNTVYVVAPRYPHNDVIYWTSANGGVSFDGGTESTFYSSKTDPTDAYLVGSNFMIGAFNSGLGFSTNEVGGLGGGSLNFTDPGSGGVAGSSMGLDGANPVIAYWNISDPPYPLLFYHYDGSGSHTSEANWVGPTEVTKGYEPNLAGGPAGLFMVSQDYSGGSQYPNAINVRRFDGTNFGAARTLAVDASTNLFVGGAIAQSPSGNRISVAWPGKRAGDGAFVMRLFTSTDGGAQLRRKPRRLPRQRLLDRPERRSGDQRRRRRLGPLPRRRRPAARRPQPDRRPAARRTAAAADLQRQNQGDRQEGRQLLHHPRPMAPGSVHVAKARVTLVLTKGKKEKKIKRLIKGTVKACR
jgi:hypothetical protein